MDNVLVNETVSNPHIGLICCTSNQCIIGNPLHKIGYGGSAKIFFKAMKYRENVNAIKLNCAGRFVAFASNALAIFDLEREIAIRQLHEHDGAVTDIAWHNSSPYQLASVSRDDSTLRTWDVRSHPAQVSVRRSQRPFSCLQYSPDCNYVACSGESIAIFDLNVAQSVVNIGCSSYVTKILFNPAECLLASASEDRLVRFWDVDTGECVTQCLPFESVIQNMKFHPEGKYLICSTSQNLSAITWEPYDLLYQTPKVQCVIPKKIKNGWNTLDLAIHDDKLLQLNVLSNFSNSENLLVPETSTVLLTSLSLKEFEKCVPNSSIVENEEYLVKDSQLNKLSHQRPNNLPILSPQHSNKSSKSNFIPTFSSSYSCSSSISSTSPVADESLTSPISATPSHRVSPVTANTIDSPIEENLSSGGCSFYHSKTSTALNEEENNKFILHKTITQPQAKFELKSTRAKNMTRRHRSTCSPINNLLATSSIPEPPSESNALKQPDSYPCNPSMSNISVNKSLKQSRSKSCGMSKIGLNNIGSKNTTGANNTLKLSEFPATTVRRLSTAATLTKSERKTVTSGHNDRSDSTKIDDLLRSGEKVRIFAKRRTTDLNSFLHFNYAHGGNVCETMVDIAAKQDDLRIFACLLKSYLNHPKFYSLTLNIKFLEKIRNLFAHQNTEYLALALDLLEMIVLSFGDSIMHGLAAKSFALGVDVAAEQRFDRCTRCRNSLLEVRLNSSFLMDRLDDKQQSLFKTILLEIDKIID